MNKEIEIKFANVSHEEIRKKLIALGAICVVPERLMKRVVIHTAAMTAKNAFVRVRDEGDRVTLTYKQFDEDTIDGAHEYETTVSNFDDTVHILSAAGLEYDVYQESKRENWELEGVEIMLDEWPWLNPYIEIEGHSEAAIQDVAEKLGFTWSDGLFGGVANLYKHQYPFIGDEGKVIINGEWKTIRFEDTPPELIQQPL